MNAFDVYLWLKLDSINSAFGTCTILLLVIGVILGFFALFHNEHDLKSYDSNVKYFKLSILLFIVFSVLEVITPTTKEYAIIRVMPMIVNSSVLQKDVPELYSVAVEALKDKVKSINIIEKDKK